MKNTTMLEKRESILRAQYARRRLAAMSNLPLSWLADSDAFDTHVPQSVLRLALQGTCDAK